MVGRPCVGGYRRLGVVAAGREGRGLPCLLANESSLTGSKHNMQEEAKAQNAPFRLVATQPADGGCCQGRRSRSVLPLTADNSRRTDTRTAVAAFGLERGCFLVLVRQHGDRSPVEIATITTVRPEYRTVRPKPLPLRITLCYKSFGMELTFL